MKPVHASVAALFILAAPQLAAAKLACYPLAHIEQALEAEYGEARHFTGHESTGIEYRLYVNARTGSWSWIGIPAGTQIGCLIFAGRGEDHRPRVEPPPDSRPPAAQF